MRPWPHLLRPSARSGCPLLQGARCDGQGLLLQAQLPGYLSTKIISSSASKQSPPTGVPSASTLIDLGSGPQLRPRRKTVLMASSLRPTSDLLFGWGAVDRRHLEPAHPERLGNPASAGQEFRGYSQAQFRRPVTSGSSSRESAGAQAVLEAHQAGDAAPTAPRGPAPTGRQDNIAAAGSGSVLEAGQGRYCHI